MIKGIANENYVTELTIVLNYIGDTQAGSFVLLQYYTLTLNLANISDVFLPITLNYWLKGGHNIIDMFNL